MIIFQTWLWWGYHVSSPATRELSMEPPRNSHPLATTASRGVVGATNNMVRKKTLLWIATCETRAKDEDLNFQVMWKTATAFQNLNTDNHSTIGDKTNKTQYHIELHNVCENILWDGFMTKIERMLQHTSKVMLQYYENRDDKVTDNEATNQKAAPPILHLLANTYNSSEWIMQMDEIQRFASDSRTDFLPRIQQEEQHYVMFLDSDVFVNGWSSASMKSLLGTFDEIRNGKQIVMGGAPACYLGVKYLPKHFEEFYPDFASPNHPGTSCPNFVNSGMYMGDLWNIWKMLVDLTFMEETGVVDRRDNDQTSHKVVPLASLLPITSDDQGRATVWYSRNRATIDLDTTAAIFRNRMFGIINHRKTVSGKNCDKNLACFRCDSNKACGRFDGNKAFQVATWNNETSREFVFHPVPTCATAAHPFVVHGAGPFKSSHAKMRQQIADHVALVENMY